MSSPPPADKGPEGVPSSEGEEEDDPALGIASTGAVVDMDVFGQLLEIVSYTHSQAGSRGLSSHPEPDPQPQPKQSLALNSVS